VTRSTRLLAVLTLAAGSAFCLGTTGPAMASTAQFSGPLYLKLAKLPVSALPAVLRARIARGESPDSIYTDAFNIENQEPKNTYCLDANDSGSTAGTNGDKVQLWTCTGKDNQYWYLGEEDSDGNYAVVNDEYQSRCLNADDTGGLGDGSKVQLWGCGGEANDMWNMTYWQDEITVDCMAFPIYLQSDNYKWDLNAVSQHIGDGDQVQIWTPVGGANSAWESPQIALIGSGGC
jgi:hypothetical protein